MTDLWWATPEQVKEFPYLYLGHHRLISDDDEPSNVPWFHSLDVDDPSSRTLYRTDAVATWRRRWLNTNVYRSLLLLSKQKQVIVGPFLVDVDNSEYDDQASAYVEDLQEAQAVARMVALFLMDRWRVAQTDMKVFFSGRKGFNFEVRPRALEIAGDLNNQLVACERLQAELRDTLKSDGIVEGVDQVFGPGMFWLPPRHPFVRLHGSINAWRSQGTDHRRRKIEVALDNLLTLSSEEIISEASG